MDRSAPRRTILVHEFVTGGGLAGAELPASWAAEGGAMRRALAEDFARVDGVRVVMTLDARLPDEPGPWDIVRVGPGEEPEAFARLAAESDYTLSLAPETGGVSLDRARTIERVGGRSLGPTAEAIALASDKLRLGEHLARSGVPTPPSRRVRPAEGLPRDHPYPAVLKPIDGTGSIQTFVIASPDDLPAEARDLPEMMLQPLVDGRAMSASFLVSGETVCSLGGALQRFERKDGQFAYLGGAAPVQLPGDEARRAVESVPGLRGWVGVDILWDDREGRVTVLEINPRPTTSYVGFRRLFPAGHLARAWLGLVADGAAPTFGFGCYQRAALVSFDADGTIRPLR